MTVDGYWRIKWREAGGWFKTTIIWHQGDAIAFINSHPGCSSEFVELPKLAVVSHTEL